jgi:hypothetical protein
MVAGEKVVPLPPPSFFYTAGFKIDTLLKKKIKSSSCPPKHGLEEVLNTCSLK